MKTSRQGIVGVLMAVVLLFGVTSPATAQLVQFSGTVTELTGGYAGRFAIGCTTLVEIDLTPPLLDQLPEIPEWGVYTGHPIRLQVDGQVCPVDVWPHTVNILNKVGGWMSGFAVDAFWPAIDTPSVLTLGLVGETDLIVSDTCLPGGIPIDAFFSREGRYYGPAGTIAWSIDAYAVLPAGTAVPEPSTYGALGTGLLAVLAMGRRWGRGLRD